MINANTAVLLGAGASAPFGFPTGDGLRQMICALPYAGSAEKISMIEGAGWHPDAVNDFVHEFAASGLRSIDSFLARRAKFERIGKCAIACCLLTREHWRSLTSVAGRYGATDWYGELWNQMMDDVQTPDQLVDRNNVRFITFNYDRSLEAFLHQAIKSTFELDDHGAYRVWSAFPIHHVYGSLGEFSSEAGFEYGVEADSSRQRGTIDRATKAIRVVPTVRHAQPDRVSVKTFEWAERLVILGFGFDRINCDYMGLKDVIARRSKATTVPRLFATTLGMTEYQIDRAMNLITGGNGSQGGRNLVSENAQNALRIWGVLGD